MKCYEKAGIPVDKEVENKKEMAGKGVDLVIDTIIIDKWKYGQFEWNNSKNITQSLITKHQSNLDSLAPDASGW